MTEIPEELQLNYYMGEIVISDSFAEHEARVLWAALFGAGILAGKRPEMFGRLLPQLEDAFGLPQVPAELREIALPLLATTRKWHKYRRDLVHDLLVTGWGRDDAVQSALGKNAPRPMDELAECGTTLRTCSMRLRGLYLIAPWWLGGTLDSWVDADGMRSWTRVAMGHIGDLPNMILGTEGPSPEPPGGWDALIAAEVGKREAEDARIGALVITFGPDDDPD
jgi:hypothetical protein